MEESGNDATGMSLDDAMRLKKDIDRELGALSALEARRLGHEYSWFGSDLPKKEDIYVVTLDGVRFGVMTFWGEYSDYSERVHWSRGEWGRAVAESRQLYFNPEGAWTHRLVMAVEEPERNRPYPQASLECGHTVNAEIRDGPPRLCQIGDRVLCYRCQAEGDGLTDDLVRDGLARAEQMLLAKSGTAS